MSTFLGRNAEAVAAEFLQQKGFTIKARNWRTRWCEIDIVALKNGITYLVEVKYRKNNAWGGGLEYITPRKLQQMQLAARWWRSQHTAHQCQLAAIELCGDPARVTQWVDDIY